MKKIDELLNFFIEREMLRGLKKKTILTKRRELNRFFDYFSFKKYTKVTMKDIFDYFNDPGNSTTDMCFNRKISYIREFYDFLVDREEALMNPAWKIENLKVTKGSHLGVFTEDEVKRIFSVIPETRLGIRDRAMLELLYSSGIRSGELVGLSMNDVDFRIREITVRKAKFDKERIVPVGDEALNALKRYMDIRERFVIFVEEGALFLSLQGRRIHTYSISERIRIYKEEAGIMVRGKAHAFRHSMASHMLKRGAPISMIQRILGHENIRDTQRYTHVLEDDLTDIHRQSHPKAREVE